jgi:hypothetical protein
MLWGQTDLQGVEMEEQRPELDPGTPGTSSANGHSGAVRHTRITPSEPSEQSKDKEQPDATGGFMGGGSGGSTDEYVGPADEPSEISDHPGDSLDETDWETTRYLAVATQLNLGYARLVVDGIVAEPFRAVAPAAGADVVVVTRWALAALRRRAQRDAVLTFLLIAGVVAASAAWTWIPIAVMVALAILVVAYERWVRDVKILARLMLRGRFRAHDAPSSSSQRIEERLTVVEQQQNGNLVVFRGKSAFIGSGQGVIHDRILANVALGKKGKDGKRQQPIAFSTPELHAALETALKNMDFPDMRVGQRLFVNGEQVSGNSQLLPSDLGPPVANAPPDLLHDGCVHPTSEARTYVCAEIGGWKGQLVVSLFTRAVQVRGSLQVEWAFHVLPPLHGNLLQIDRKYELPRFWQFAKALVTGVLWFVPALVSAPVTFARYVALPLVDQARIRNQSYRIRNGYVFNYGSTRSIRENPISYRRPHDFVAGDELTFILLAQHTMLRALGRFLKMHKVDMKQFADQEQAIINKINNYNVDKINAKNVAVGNKSRARGSKNSSGSSSEK